MKGKRYRERVVTGKRFGLWLVLQRVKNRPTYWLCRCQCGTLRPVFAPNLVRGDSQSCGCLGQEKVVAATTTHGMSGTPCYREWARIIQQCYNTKYTEYKDYGAKGITVCESWRTDFTNFYRDMGDRPLHHRLVRHNEEGNYEPGNCFWRKQDSIQTRRESLIIEWEGKQQPLLEVLEQLNLNPSTFRARLRSGWPFDRALKTPVENRNSHKTKGSPPEHPSNRENPAEH